MLPCCGVPQLESTISTLYFVLQTEGLQWQCCISQRSCEMQHKEKDVPQYAAGGRPAAYVQQVVHLLHNLWC